MSEHTPTPWMASNQYLYAGDRTLPIASGQHDWATDCGGASHKEAVANAAFIVKAVNCHDHLVKALEASCGYLLNAKIDLETGCTKATAIRTIEGGLLRAKAVLALVKESA